MTTDESREEHRHGEGPEEAHPDDKAHERRMYVRFGLMIATSTVVMFVLTYTNTFAVGPRAVERGARLHGAADGRGAWRS